MSKLLSELYSLLHIHSIRTSPYHPQTDGLVERFNQTLKSMLRKAVDSEGKNWDTLTPYLLFAYREVPQASTGFSPFELVYRRNVRGPLRERRQSASSAYPFQYLSPKVRKSRLKTSNKRSHITGDCHRRHKQLTGHSQLFNVAR